MGRSLHFQIFGHRTAIVRIRVPRARAWIKNQRKQLPLSFVSNSFWRCQCTWNNLFKFWNETNVHVERLQIQLLKFTISFLPQIGCICIFVCFWNHVNSFNCSTNPFQKRNLFFCQSHIAGFWYKSKKKKKTKQKRISPETIPTMVKR